MGHVPPIRTLRLRSGAVVADVKLGRAHAQPDDEQGGGRLGGPVLSQGVRGQGRSTRRQLSLTLFVACAQITAAVPIARPPIVPSTYVKFR